MNSVRKTKSRFASQPLNSQSASMPAFDNAAIMAGRTIYPTTVRAGVRHHAIIGAVASATK
jgi:hypothetical protein